MTKEELIKFIESKGFMGSEQSQFKNGPMVIYVCSSDWGMGWGDTEYPGEYFIDKADLQYPKTEADATEFFRILGI